MKCLFNKSSKTKTFSILLSSLLLIGMLFAILTTNLTTNNGNVSRRELEAKVYLREVCEARGIDTGWTSGSGSYGTSMFSIAEEMRNTGCSLEEAIHRHYNKGIYNGDGTPCTDFKPHYYDPLYYGMNVEIDYSKGNTGGSNTSSSHTHKWEVTSETESTCKEVGVIKYECSCGKTKTENKDLKEHTNKLTSTIPGTCLTPSKYTYTCSVCNEVTEVEGVLAKHQYEETERVDATCTENGYVVLKCVTCDDKQTEELEATGHDFKLTTSKEANCTEDGLIENICTKCNVVNEIDSKVVKAKGHTEKYEVITEPTKLKDGLAHTICEVCNEELSTEILPATMPWLLYVFIGGGALLIILIILIVVKSKKK